MRRYVLPILAIYIDFIIVNAAYVLVDHFAGDWIASGLGGPLTWAWSWVVSLLVVLVLHLLGYSVGNRLLSQARTERAAGVQLRQWPNLVMGTLLLLSGLKELVRWTLPGDGMPFLFMVDETPLKLTALTANGLLYVAGGVMLLAFTPGARLFNSALFAFGIFVMATNFIFFREAMVQAQIDRRLSLGQSADVEAAERIVSYVPIYGVVFMLALFGLLYFCRERAR